MVLVTQVIPVVYLIVINMGTVLFNQERMVIYLNTADSRRTSYINKFGDESWELDTLEPRVLHDLITTDSVTEFMDEEEVKRVRRQVESERYVMNSIADNWETVYEEYSE